MVFSRLVDAFCSDTDGRVVRSQEVGGLVEGVLVNTHGLVDLLLANAFAS